MALTSRDIVSLSHARSRLSDLCEEVRASDREKIITKGGESCAALIGAERLDHYHRLEREHVHIALLEDAVRGVADLAAGRALSPRQLRSRHGRST